jgi:hypothetical protein
MKKYLQFIKEDITIDDIEDILLDIKDNYPSSINKFEKYIELYIFLDGLDRNNLDSILEYSEKLYNASNSIKEVLEKIKKIDKDIFYSVHFHIERQIYVQIDLSK